MSNKLSAIEINKLIKQQMEETNSIIQKKNNEYYLNVLDFLNLLFKDDAKNIQKIKFKHINFDDKVILLHNKIIETYKLDKPTLKHEIFFEQLENIDEDEVKSVYCEIASKMSNNLLEKLDYKLVLKKVKDDKKSMFFLTQIK